MMLICCLQKIMKSAEILAFRRNIDTESTIAWLKSKLTSKRVHQTVKVRLNDRWTNRTTKDIRHGMDTISRIDHYSFVSYSVHHYCPDSSHRLLSNLFLNLYLTASNKPESAGDNHYALDRLSVVHYPNNTWHLESVDW